MLVKGHQLAVICKPTYVNIVSLALYLSATEVTHPIPLLTWINFNPYMDK